MFIHFFTFKIHQVGPDWTPKWTGFGPRAECLASNPSTALWNIDCTVCLDCQSSLIGLRSLWFTGQFQCGSKRCEKQEGLRSWEVNFAYVEHSEKRNALVKLSKSSQEVIHGNNKTTETKGCKVKTRFKYMHGIDNSTCPSWHQSLESIFLVT